METNPGLAAIGYMDLQHQVSCSPSLLKFFHVNAQSARKQRTHFMKLIQDLTPNTIFGINETWLTPEDDEKLWDLDPLYSSFRNDRKCNTRGGDVLLAVPKILSPKVRPDLCTQFEQTSFESMWVEYSSTGSGTKAVVAVLYNPSNSLIDSFLNTLNRSIDIVAAEGQSLTIMGDFNINYLKESERTNLSTVLNPYGLKVCNAFLPTRITENGSSIIDYIVTDTSLTDSFVCDTKVKSDHLAQLEISHCNIKPSKEAVRKVQFDKRYYSIQEFSITLSQQNWGFLWTLAYPEKQLEYFTNTFERVLRLHAPKKAVFVRTARKNHLKSWFNDECKHALQEKQDAFRTFSENQNETNRKHYREKTKKS